jgi:hypothetical protein
LALGETFSGLYFNLVKDLLLIEVGIDILGFALI